MGNFSDHLYDVAAKTIRSWKDAANDIYAISFYVEHEDDDPYLGVLKVGYNTTQHWKRAISDASDDAEAKWNYAFWPQDIHVAIGSSTEYGSDDGRDADGIELRERWLETLGLNLDTDDEEEIDENDERLVQAFVDQCVSAAKRLHESGVIRETFGRDVPILVHELEYYDRIAEQTRRANPDGLTADFEAWIAEM